MFLRKYRVDVNDVVMEVPYPTFIDTGGVMYQTRPIVPESDGGSIPPAFRWIAGDEDAFPLSYTFHDDGVRNGGLYRVIMGRRIFVPMPRSEVDDLLSRMLPAEGCKRYQAKKIVLGARIGTLFAFDDRKDQTEN